MFAPRSLAASKCRASTVPEIFADHGEAYFRDGERKVIATGEACIEAPEGQVCIDPKSSTRPTACA